MDAFSRWWQSIRYEKKESGQTLVEFALVLPLLLILILGAIEFGRIFHATHVITSAAREGARAAAVGGDNDDIGVKVTGAVSSFSTHVERKEFGTGPGQYDAVDPPDGYVYYTIDPYSNRTGDISVTIHVKGAIMIVVPIIEKFFSENPKIIESQAEMRLE